MGRRGEEDENDERDSVSYSSIAPGNDGVLISPKGFAETSVNEIWRHRNRRSSVEKALTWVPSQVIPNMSHCRYGLVKTPAHKVYGSCFQLTLLSSLMRSNLTTLCNNT
jgi:hypothetical protein